MICLFIWFSLTCYAKCFIHVFYKIKHADLQCTHDPLLPNNTPSSPKQTDHCPSSIQWCWKWQRLHFATNFIIHFHNTCPISSSPAVHCACGHYSLTIQSPNHVLTLTSPFLKKITSAYYAFSSIQIFDRPWMDLGGCLFHKKIISLLCFLLLYGELWLLNFSCQELCGRNSSFGPYAF